jgi:hypothetical protein
MYTTANDCYTGERTEVTRSLDPRVNQTGIFDLP